MSFADRALLAVEIEQSLRCGRAFLSQRSPVPVLADCVLVLVHPEHGGELRLPAQVVMTNEHGTGLSLTTLTAQHLSELNAFADSAPPLTAAAEVGSGQAAHARTSPPPAQNTQSARANPGARRSVPPPRAEPMDPFCAGSSTAPPPDAAAEQPRSGGTRPPPCAARDLALEQPRSGSKTWMPPAASDAAPEQSPSGSKTWTPPAASNAAEEPPPCAAGDVLSGPHPLGSAELSADSAHDPRAAQDPFDLVDFPRSDEQELEYADGPGSGSSRPVELQSESRQERLRHLSLVEQLKVARRGELADRLAVERMYGKQVWEALLQNPRLTIPEVAKIARKGTVPKPLLDMILDNSGWIKADAVRRALLSNPKIGADAVMKLLRLTSKHELKLIEKGSAYGASVREAARKLLRQA